jgi:hypothetical protein
MTRFVFSMRHYDGDEAAIAVMVRPMASAFIE